MILFIRTVLDCKNRMSYTVAEPSVQYHSEQAMVAARKMRSTKYTKQKRQTGQVVCHHLKMMLSRELAPEISSLTGVAVICEIDKHVGDSANDQAQFQLSF